MRVLVLGGTGFVGPHIVRRLVAEGHIVAVFRRRPSLEGLAPGVRLISGDRNQLESSADEFRSFAPDVVVDAIAFTEAQAEGLVKTFRGLTKRLIVLSSGDVYRANDILFRRVDGPCEPAPLSEQSLLRERLFPYRGVPVPPVEGFNWDDYDKILVEQVVMSHPDLPATVLRLPMVYGPGDSIGSKRRFWPYLKRMIDRRQVVLMDELTARWRAPWGYVEDVAESVQLAIANEKAAGEIYNVGESAGLDWEGWVRELAAVVGWKGRIAVVDQPCPPPSLPRSLRLEQNLEMNTDKIRRDLGYRETLSRREALERTVAWESGHPPEQFEPSQIDYAAEDAILA